MSEKELINYFQEKIDNGNHKIFTDITDFEYKVIDAINCIEQLQQENQNLKEELEDMTLCRDIASGHRKELQDEELRERRLKEKYKSVLDEIREYIKEHTMVDYNEFEYISTSPKAMLQILDKVNK